MLEPIETVFFELLKQWFGLGGVLVSLLLTVGGLWLWNCLGTSDRGRFISCMNDKGSRGDRYYGVLSAFLTWTEKDTIFGKEYGFWNATGYRTALNLAVIYPICFMLIDWVVTGSNTSGIPDFLPDGMNSLRRVMGVLLLGISIFSMRKLFRATGWGKILWCCFWIVAGVFAGAVVGVVGGVGIVAVAVVIAIAGIGAGAVANTFVFVAAAAVAGGIAGVVVAVGAVVVSAVVVAAVIAAAVIAGRGAVVAAGAGVAVVAVVAAGAGVAVVAVVAAGAGVADVAGVAVVAGVVGGVMYLENCFSKIFYAFFAPVFLVLLYAVSFWLGTRGVPVTEATKGLLIFFVFLPVVNSIFDFASYTVIRRYIRQISNKRTLPEAWRGLILSALIAVILMVLLLVACAGGLCLLNWLSGMTFFDFQKLLDIWKNNYLDPSILWIYFTLLSSLLPLLIHCAIVLWSLIAIPCPQWLRTKIITVINDFEKTPDSVILRGKGTLLLLSYYVIEWGLAIAVPVLLTLYSIVWLVGGMFDIFKSFM